VVLPAEECAIFKEQALETTWAKVLADAPVWGPKFKKLMVREPFRGAK
ncbi:unnamed protein product, partial [marine sediment metagenome]